MTSAKYRSGAARNVLIGSLIACGSLVSAHAAYGPAAGSLAADSDTASAPASASPGVAPSPSGNAPAQPGNAPAQPNDTPAQPSDTPAQPNDTPAQPVDTPAQPVDTPAQPNDTPARPADTPAQPVDTPAQPSDTPAQPSDTPAQPSDTPAQPSDTPAQPADTPAQPSDTPAQPADTPAQPSDTPAQPADTPAQPADTPARPADTPSPPGDTPAAGSPAPASETPPAEAYRFVVDPKLNDEVVGEVQITYANQQDSLADIARRFSVGYNEIERANPGVDMWVPGAGRRVVVPTQFVLPDAPQVGIVVNIAQMRLYYFPPRKHGGQQIVYTYPIGIGRVSWKTPSGITTVVRKVVNPVWRPPADIREEHREDGDPLPAEIRPGPDDPMGTRALYLGWPEYAIHGTNKPVGVGMRVSHGCMHLYPEDILQLYDMVPLGTTVRVVNQPFVFGWHRGELYMQAFGPLAGDQRDWQAATPDVFKQAMGPGILTQLQARNEQVRWDLILRLAHDPQGIPVAITDSSTSLQQVLENAAEVQNRAPDGAPTVL